MKYTLIIYLFFCSSCTAQVKINQATAQSLQQKSDSLKILFALIKALPVLAKNDSVKTLYTTTSLINAKLVTLQTTVAAIKTDTLWFKGFFGMGTKLNPIRLEQ